MTVPKYEMKAVNGLINNILELGVSKLRGYREFVSARDIVTVYIVYCTNL